MPGNKYSAREQELPVSDPQGTGEDHSAGPKRFCSFGGWRSLHAHSQGGLLPGISGSRLGSGGSDREMGNRSIQVPLRQFIRSTNRGLAFEAGKCGRV